jgi:ureidoacrylate peracid hydrolase
MSVLELRGDMNNNSEAANKVTVLGTAGREFYRLGTNSVDMTRPGRDVRPVQIEAAPQPVLIDLNKTALIVIDMQNDFCMPGGWLNSLGVDVTPTRKPIHPLKRVTEALRGQDVPVIWVNWAIRPDRLNLSPGTRLTFHRAGNGIGLGDPMRAPACGPAGEMRVLQKDSLGAAIIEELSPPATDIFVDKHRISGFWDTPLDSILRNLGVRTLLFAGVNADECVLATLMDANFHGYDTLMLEDCVGTTSPSFCMEATLYNVRFCFGFTLSSTALLSALRETEKVAPPRDRATVA